VAAYVDAKPPRIFREHQTPADRDDNVDLDFSLPFLSPSYILFVHPFLPLSTVPSVIGRVL
jgi:hypothetical protein